MEQEVQTKERETFASTIVSDVLEKAVSQLVIDRRDGGGDAVTDGLAGDSDKIGCHGNASQDRLLCTPGQEVGAEHVNAAEEEIPSSNDSPGPTHLERTEAEVDSPLSEDWVLLESQDGNTVAHVERGRSSVSSRMLEVHLPQNAVCATECRQTEYEAVGSGNTVNPAVQVSQSYPPVRPPTQDQDAVSPIARSPSSRLIQFPQRRPSRDIMVHMSTGSVRVGDVSSRQRILPSLTRMSTVLMNTRARAEKQRRTSTFFEEKSQTKLLSLDQCINSRPPMPFDLECPGPCRYSPPSKPLNETNSPRYTFGHRFNERGGGGRTAWSKTWFNSHDSETIKVNFEDKWPSPTNHSRSLTGRKLPSKPTFPSFSIGVRKNFTISKRGSEKEPSPNAYDPSKADRVMYTRAPAFTMAFRHRGTALWSPSELTPAPDIYTPRLVSLSSKPHRPAFTIQGIRRPKSHALGPHATF